MNHRGLTLIEVLAATALLTILAVTCVPLLRAALGSFHHQSTSTEIDLALIADHLLQDPALFGFKDEDQLVAMDSPTDVAVPDKVAEMIELAEPISVTVTCLRATDPEIEHGWLVIRYGDQVVPRWLKIPTIETQSQERGP